MSESEAKLRQTAEEWAAKGMILGFWAETAPERLAIVSKSAQLTYGELNRRANQLVRALRRQGLKAGDAVALLCSNRPEFVEVCAAAARAGFRLTPINWHLTGPEVGYIVDNCEARAFIADARFAGNAVEASAMAPGLETKLSVGGPMSGFRSYDEALAVEADENIDDPSPGTQMLYTSGTTGHPKGVYRAKTPPPSLLVKKLQETAAFSPGQDMSLVTGPLYHAAPLALNLSFPLNAGVGVVLMDKWDAEETLRLVAEYKITHTHVVPTMLHRMLSLPETVRAKYDLSSLRWVLHGAAPCPVHVKEDTIKWLGPVVYEYYAATEGGGIFADAHEWLSKPGTVGRALEGVVVEVHDDEGKPVAAGEIGTIYFKAPETGRFEYFKAPEKTEGAYRGDYYTMGDMGFMDADGFLFLTGRSAEVIISGGVNIYPAEVDQELLRHPAVADVATIGVPNDEWGEEVKAVVQLADGIAPSEEIRADLMQFAADHLPGYKRPRSIDFATDLPRLPTGKIVRRQVREPYWEGRTKQI
ncbi:MAG: acyl-CoA synthase [Rhodobiaceae bacterium]|nr:acyl-CoA synthase [Rhodobiaceae bacterium]